MITKRSTIPSFWPIAIKQKKYSISTSPGPHAKNFSFPLAIIVRDMMGYAENIREVKKILSEGHVTVDGKKRKDISFPVGLMDVISIGDKHFRVLPSKNGLYLNSIKENESEIKLLRVRNKTIVKGKTQLNLHDGKNIIVDKDVYKTGDVVVYDIKNNKIKDVIQIKRGALAMIIKGQNAGNIGRIEEIIIVRSSQPNKVVLKLDKGMLETRLDYIFLIGQEKPLISLGEMR